MKNKKVNEKNLLNLLLQEENNIRELRKIELDRVLGKGDCSGCLSTLPASMGIMAGGPFNDDPG